MYYFRKDQLNDGLKTLTAYPSTTLQYFKGTVKIYHNSMAGFICMLLGQPGDSELEIGRGRIPSLRILQFIHTLQQQGPFIHTDPLSLCEWRAECIKVCQLLSQNQRLWSYFISTLGWKFVKWARGDVARNKQLAEIDTLLQVSWQEVTKQWQPVTCCLSTLHLSRQVSCGKMYVFIRLRIAQAGLIRKWSKWQRCNIYKLNLKQLFPPNVL